MIEVSVKLKILLIVLFSYFLVSNLSAHSNLDVQAIVDETITKQIDVTGDGKVDIIVLKLKGKDLLHPFVWTLEITSNGEQIFNHTSDDVWLDKNFHDQGFVLHCEGYVQCKHKYYYHDLLDNLFIKTDLSANPHAFDISNQGSIHWIAKKYLVNKHDLTENKAEKIIQKMMLQIKTGSTSIMYVPISPVQTEFPQMYVEEIRDFVTIYHW